MKQYETFELRFSGPEPENQWACADLTASFTCGEKTVTVRGFYDGDRQYAVRFLPDTPGEYAWRVNGIVNAERQETCEPAQEARGPVRAVGTHFEYMDGTLFLPFGTTVYALASQEDPLVEQTLESLRQSPFNKVRMCVFPKHYDYNHNEPPLYAFERREDGSWDTGRPDIAFWQRFERILDRLSEMDIQADLILFHPYDRWGFAAMPREDNLQYLDYLLRRFAAKPDLWWSLANEYDLCLDRKSLRDWEEIEEYVARNDPYHHLLSNHNCMRFWDFARPNTTHACIQTKALTELPRWIHQWKKPVIIDECCYEGNLQHFWGSISGQEMARRFWRCFASGAYCTHGETFLDENDVLWWARGGRLKGESPKRIAFLRQIAESLPGPLEPMNEGLSGLAELSDEQLEAEIARTPGDFRQFLVSIRMMDSRDRALHLAGEHTWSAHCGEKAYLWFHDRQCYGWQILKLPENRRYRVELIDIREMTRTVLCDAACGETEIRLPGREDLAVLAVEIPEQA